MSYPNTPGIKVKETPLLPPSIVQVSTAIPVFLGYTEKNPDHAVKIGSLAEYEANFGGAYAYQYDITYTENATTNQVTYQTPVKATGSQPVGTYFLHEALQAYFLNGGGDCYILSVGDHSDTPAKSHFTSALQNKIELLDEPTLILFPEAVQLTTDTDYADVVKEALKVANTMGDKFVILDTPVKENPYKGDGTATDTESLTGFRGDLGKNNLNRGAAYYPHLETSMTYRFKDTSTFTKGVSTSPTVSLATHKDNGSAEYEHAMTYIRQELGKITLPPSPFMAGIYVKVDAELGVWKAPANISVLGVRQPQHRVSDNLQQEFNVDADSGKSINIIRSFPGKGNLVWGARTLAGNDNEWRYINVRRLFLAISESVKKATSQFVFENNDAKTWVKVSSMIKAYLNGIWQEGGLQGVTPEEAYFVEVGIGTTMTQAEVLEGKMVVRIGVAAVRPAEFITLEFSHYINR